MSISSKVVVGSILLFGFVVGIMISKYENHVRVEQLRSNCLSDLINAGVERKHIVLTDTGCEVKM